MIRRLTYTQAAIREESRECPACAEASPEELDAARALLRTARWIVSEFLDQDRTPERNCRCHISPPCNDCVEYGGWRETLEHAWDFLTDTAPNAADQIKAEMGGENV